MGFTAVLEGMPAIRHMLLYSLSIIRSALREYQKSEVRATAIRYTVCCILTVVDTFRTDLTTASILSAASLTSSDVIKDSQFDRLSSVCICTPLVCVFFGENIFPDFENRIQKRIRAVKYTEF